MVGPAVSILIGLQQAPDLLRGIGKKYDLQIEIVTGPYSWKGRGYTVDAKAPDQKDLENYVKLFASEWSRYPAAIIKTAQVKKIVFCSNLRLSGQVRAAVPAFEASTMFYDTTLGNYSASYQRNVIHHEFFHMIDNLQRKLTKDPAWSALNLSAFRYGHGGYTVRTEGAGILTDMYPGFLTFYAMSAIEEDKAELYSHLLVDPDFVKGRGKVDSIISTKISLLKSRLKNWATQFNEDFWASKAT